MRCASVVVAMFAVVAASPSARASSVVVFPLDSRGLDEASAAAATRVLLETLATVPGLEIIAPEAARKRLGVDLTEQARACTYDVFCLVEVGELLQGDLLLIGHLSRPAPTDPTADEGLELKVMVLDVAKAAITEVLLWRVPDLDPDALGEAAEAAVRRLMSPRDVEVIFDLTPDSARVRFYGEPVTSLEPGQPMRYWSGIYHARVDAEGYHPRELRVRLPAGQGVLRIPVTLEADPLWVAGAKSGTRPFDKPSRRTGSGAVARTAGALERPVVEPRAHATALPWIVVGAGVGLSVLGGVLMAGAQSGYNDLASQRRYTPGLTFTADLAMRDRDRDRTLHRAGSGVLIAGIGVVVGGAVWMLVDALAADDKPARAELPAPPAPRDPAVERAARWMALELAR